MIALSQGMKAGLRDGAAVGMTAALLGVMYALAALEAGLSALEAIFYSAVVYSAAVQFAALGTETTLGAVFTLLSGSLFICSRNVLMSLDMARKSEGRLVELLSLHRLGRCGVGHGARI
jgi:predicted branched-subunit amino acid permease